MSDTLVENESSEGDQLSDVLTINHDTGKQFIKMKDIVFLKANNVYTYIHLKDKSKLLTAIPLYKFEDMLDMTWFFRIHKSHIINTLHFKEYSSKTGHYAIMNNGEKLLISKYRLASFLEFIEKRKNRTEFS